MKRSFGILYQVIEKTADGYCDRAIKCVWFPQTLTQNQAASFHKALKQAKESGKGLSTEDTIKMALESFAKTDHILGELDISPFAGHFWF